MKDKTVTLNLTEYEASIVTGALAEYAARWGDDVFGAAKNGDGQTADYLRELVRNQLPEGWR